MYNVQLVLVIRDCVLPLLTIKIHYKLVQSSVWIVVYCVVGHIKIVIKYILKPIWCHLVLSGMLFDPVFCA